ncbi:adenylosuccinate lyase [Pseudozobellia thermophila]|uniref:adenylosuccinate lyase n=1 Tax=Pseudozobellia thermophila TaxID=192903 RepID=UPI000932FDD8|nr:adenylosuccinate lyase [Pseudozobellia thermophila]
MGKEELYQVLDHVDHSREKRAEMSSLILSRPDLVAPLMEIAFTFDDPISSRASWVLEFTAKENLDCIIPHLDLFTAHIGQVRFDSAVRPMAKICEYLTKAYFSNSENKIQKALTDRHLELITNTCFDWLIGEHKVAAKAYSMTSLLLLGSKYAWIWPELKMVIEQNYANGSAAYKARARHTLAQLK